MNRSMSSSTSSRPWRPTSRCRSCTRRSKASSSAWAAVSRKPKTGAAARLAYEIGHQKEGACVLEVITGSGDLMKEIDRRLKVIDYVIRHLIVRVDEDEQVVERRRSKRTEVSRRRRVARGLPPERQPGEGQRGDFDDERDEDHDDRFNAEDVR